MGGKRAGEWIKEETRPVAGMQQLQSQGLSVGVGMENEYRGCWEMVSGNAGGWTRRNLQI